jgi:Ras family protein T1
VGVRRVVQEKKKEGVNDLGLTLEGFLFLHSLFIDKGRLETTWAVLRKFGYGNDLKLRDDFLPAPSKDAPDQVCVTDIHYWTARLVLVLINSCRVCSVIMQSVELTIEAVEFVRRVFRLFDTDNVCINCYQIIDRHFLEVCFLFPFICNLTPKEFLMFQSLHLIVWSLTTY